MRNIGLYLILTVLAASLPLAAMCQNRGSAKIAVVQASAMPNEDPFMGNYDPTAVYPKTTGNFNNILKLFEQAGEMGADLVCGPEDIQNIGSYGLHVDKKDPVTGKILFNSLALSVP